MNIHHPTFITSLKLAASVAALSLLGLSAHGQTTIYADSFGGGATDLNGRAPDTRPGTETWSSLTGGAQTWLQNGTLDGTAAFTCANHDFFRDYTRFIPSCARRSCAPRSARGSDGRLPPKTTLQRKPLASGSDARVPD